MHLHLLPWKDELNQTTCGGRAGWASRSHLSSLEASSRTDACGARSMALGALYQLGAGADPRAVVATNHRAAQQFGTKLTQGAAPLPQRQGQLLCLGVVMAFCITSAVAQPAQQGLANRHHPIPATPRPDCHYHAVQYHGVNSEVLRAILWNESRMNPNAINRNNRNGSVDVGIGQHNSIHFKDLATVGVTPKMLLDPCVGIYVAAWHLSKSLRRHGNTWFAIGAYHSSTPLFNNAYANDVANTLALWGQVPKGFIPFPNAPRNTAAALRLRGGAAAQAPKAAGPSSMVALEG